MLPYVCGEVFKCRKGRLLMLGGAYHFVNIERFVSVRIEKIENGLYYFVVKREEKRGGEGGKEGRRALESTKVKLLEGND